MENRNHFTMKSMNFFCVGMLIPGKMHPESRVAIPGCQSRLLNFTTVCTIYPYMIKVGSPAAGPRLCSRTPSIDWHSMWWCTRNVTKRLGEAVTGGARTGKCNGRSAPGRRAWELPPPCRMPLDNWLMSRVGWPRKNGRQRPGLRHHSIHVKTQAGNTRNICPRCSLPLRYASVLCFAASVRLVCGPQPWWSKQVIHWQQARSDR